MNPHIFREYDIRGVAQTDLTDEVVEKIGLSFATYLARDGANAIVVGRDVRLSSDRLSRVITKSLVDTGRRVIDVGVVPTPILYFSIYHYEADGGVMVTGSHNPKDYNGFKLCKGKSNIYGETIQELRRIAEKGKFVKGSGSVRQDNPIPAYMQAIRERIDLGRPLKVLIDAGNGTVGPVAEELLQKLGVAVECLYCEPDGNFPNHLPDPTVEKYMQDLIKGVRTKGVDAGIGYDGDGDRIGVVDENGNMVWGDRLLGIFSKGVLRKAPGAKIIFDVKCSQGLVEFIEREGGIPLMWKTGHSLIKAKMREEEAPLAGEMSGHMFFADNYYGYDDAIYASVRLLEIMSHATLPLSGLAAEVPYYQSTPEIRVDCEDERKFEVVETLKKYFAERHEIIAIDGVRVLFDEGWGLIRASNTQPVLVLRFEAKTSQKLGEIKTLIFNKLKEFGIKE
ncbi:phosphomannomutase [candidate division TA06 bacterium DG_26]|uniref:Phosphomannomutase n=1 Tax=candidate division TA06 bacterium DG_26 TaxID=1703771 RepID=A0A0S7WM49_UNCT6|nr:MAG: phosphomannomutase [candidate division TA06 bacterium DG_26]